MTLLVASGTPPARGMGQLSAADVLINTVPINQIVPILAQGYQSNPTAVAQVANVTSGVTDMQLNRTIDGASSIVMQLQDPHRSIINSGMFNFGDVLAWDGLNFALVQFAKQGDQLQITFEAALAYDLRKQTGAFTWASTTDLPGFVEHLLTAVPGATLVAQPGAVSFDTGSGVDASSTATATSPIARGTTETPNEDSWTCINRLANSCGYRVYECEYTIYLGSDDWLLTEFPSAGTLVEFTPAIMNMDGTYDIGMPRGQISVTAITQYWPYHPGQPVTIARLGPLNGVWLVYSMQRDLFNPEGTMTLETPMTAEQVRLGVPSLQYV
jgi:hypothetical protein